MKIKKAIFIKSCFSARDFPAVTHPEIAVMGRSNVGKSSLINMLAGNKSLVKTGSKPGVTKAINFFIINDTISLVDLPGYGYAKIPMELKKKFLPLIKSYITNRKNLKLVFLLIDIRRLPEDFEHEMLSLLIKNKIPVVITVTKSDKLSGNKRSVQVSKIIKALDIEKESLFLTSSKNNTGKKELLQLIEDYASN